MPCHQSTDWDKQLWSPVYPTVRCLLTLQVPFIRLLTGLVFNLVWCIGTFLDGKAWWGIQISRWWQNRTAGSHVTSNSDFYRNTFFKKLNGHKKLPIWYLVVHWVSLSPKFCDFLDLSKSCPIFALVDRCVIILEFIWHITIGYLLVDIYFIFITQNMYFLSQWDLFIGSTVSTDRDAVQWQAGIQIQNKSELAFSNASQMKDTLLGNIFACQLISLFSST